MVRLAVPVFSDNPKLAAWVRHKFRWRNLIYARPNGVDGLHNTPENRRIIAEDLSYTG